MHNHYRKNRLYENLVYLIYFYFIKTFPNNKTNKIIRVRMLLYIRTNDKPIILY